MVAVLLTILLGFEMHRSEQRTRDTEESWRALRAGVLAESAPEGAAASPPYTGLRNHVVPIGHAVKGLLEELPRVLEKEGKREAALVGEMRGVLLRGFAAWTGCVDVVLADGASRPEHATAAIHHIAHLPSPSSLDVVVLDSSPPEEVLIARLRLWWAALRIGGLLCGIPAAEHSTVRAVERFAQEQSIPLHLSAQGAFMMRRT